MGEDNIYFIIAREISSILDYAARLVNHLANDYLTSKGIIHDELLLAKTIGIIDENNIQKLLYVNKIIQFL